MDYSPYLVPDTQKRQHDYVRMKDRLFVENGSIDAKEWEDVFIEGPISISFQVFAARGPARSNS
jgi:hypothetical protein